MSWIRRPKVVPAPSTSGEDDRAQTKDTVARLEAVTEEIRLTTLELKMLVTYVARDEGIPIQEISTQ